jgi:hypothetical protein
METNSNIYEKKLEEQSKEYISKQIIDIQNGYLCPLKSFVSLKALQEEITKALDTIKPLAVKEAEKYAENKFKLHGATIEKRRGAGSWNFDGIERYFQAKNKIKEIEESHKNAYKASLKGEVMVDENGEQIQPAFYKEGENIIAVSFK